MKYYENETVYKEKYNPSTGKYYKEPETQKVERIERVPMQGTKVYGAKQLALGSKNLNKDISFVSDGLATKLVENFIQLQTEKYHQYDINKVAESIKKNMEHGKNYAIVVVAEGAKPKDGEIVVSKVVEDSPDPIRLGGIANVVAEQLEKLVGNEARATILGHVQRGGSPTANDRILSTRYGTYAVELVMQGKFGNMVTLDGNAMSYESLENVIGANKAVDPNGELVTIAEATGVSFGR